jgi:hypothetical protein
MTRHVAVSPDVEALLRRACFDCHSHETRWPWYSKVSPVSWYVVHDIEHGLSNLDFSQWSTDPVREPTPVQRLTWICRDIREGLMPPAAYRFMHPAARLSPTEEAAICAWTERARAGLP